MEKNFNEAFLNQPISKLEASEEFILVTEKYGYHTLADILKLEKPYDVLEHEGFGVRMLAEFTHLLVENDLGHYLN